MLPGSLIFNAPKFYMNHLRLRRLAVLRVLTTHSLEKTESEFEPSSLAGSKAILLKNYNMRCVGLTVVQRDIHVTSSWFGHWLKCWIRDGDSIGCRKVSTVLIFIHQALEPRRVLLNLNSFIHSLIALITITYHISNDYSCLGFLTECIIKAVPAIVKLPEGQQGSLEWMAELIYEQIFLSSYSQVNLTLMLCLR